MLPNNREKQELQREVIRHFVEKSAAFQKVFSGPDGEIVLDYLRKQKAGFDKDPYQHAYNAGKTSILRIIEEMLDEKQYEKHLEFLKNAQTAKE